MPLTPWVLAKALQALFLLVLRALALRRSHTGAVLWVDTCLAKRKINCWGPWQKRKLIASRRAWQLNLCHYGTVQHTVHGPQGPLTPSPTPPILPRRCRSATVYSFFSTG